MRLVGKIGVYGRSLGGIPTSYLSEKADMIIADRTFGNLDEIVERKFYSYSLRLLFRMATFGWQAYNDHSVTSNGCYTCHKVVITDKNDEVVDLQGSLMVCIG